MAVGQLAGQRFQLRVLEGLCVVLRLFAGDELVRQLILKNGKAFGLNHSGRHFRFPPF